MITFTNLSGSSDIGSNSYLLNMDGVRVVLDAGMHPKLEGNAAKPDYSLIGPVSPEAIFVTHSHLDHVGTLPVVQEAYPDAQVFMTNGTCEVADAMLHNSVNVMTSKRTQEGIVEYPFYTHAELDQASRCWIARPYDEPFRVGQTQQLLATFFDAGHILGSCGVMLESERGTTFFYTGDVQFDKQTMIPGADFPTEGVDILAIECTHGATPTNEAYSRKKELLRFAQCIRETINNNGAVLIPVFALGKSQELLYELGRFRNEGLIPDVPIYFGGLSSKITMVYDRMANTTPRNEPGYRLRDNIEVCSLPRKGKAPLVASAGNIYLVSSGMMSEHTVSNVLAAQLLPRKNDAILFVGYSDPETPAAWIKKTEEGELVRLQAKGGQAYPRNCRLECFNFSGHASRNALIEYTCKLKPSTVLLVHGDPDALEWMQNTLSEKMPECQILIPEPGQTLKID